MDNHTIEFTTITKPEDLAQVRAIADIIWPITFKPILSPEQITYMMNMMYAPEVMEKEMAEGIRFELLKIDGKNAGYMIYGDYKPGIMKLHKLYLLSEYHSRGYGSAMLQHVAEEARKAGYTTLRLNVNKYNDRAIRAYNRKGFLRVESVKNDIGGGFYMDDYVMDLNLKDIRA